MASKAGRLKQKALSVVDSVHTLGSHNSSNSCTITVKSCPQRSAAEMTKLSVRRGWMLKRNEQRAWQRRYCCLVPHTFMYYFESKDSEVPRGVIDLEAYTDIGVEESTGAIVLGPGPDAPPGFRKFYFRPEDNTVHRGSKDSRFLSRSRAVNSSGSSSSEGPGCEASMREDDVELHAGEEDGVWEGIGDGGGGGRLGEWLSGLHRERFKVVRDERDAYMNLQEEYMMQMQDTTSAMSEAESERGRVLEGLRAEHAAARAAARDGLEQARALFREEELPQEEAASLPLPALLARVRAMASERRAREAELEEELSSALAALGEARRVEGDSRGLAERLRSEAEEAIERARNAEARIRRAEEEAARERALRAAAESSLDTCNQRLQAATVDLEQGQVNLGIMAGERRAALAKAAELLEQKRLLVREVKALRRSLAEASSVNRSLARAYESLDHSLRTSSSITSTTVTNEDTSAEMENRGSLNSAPGTSAAGSTLPPPPSPPGSSVGSLGGVDEWRDWRETRLSISSQQGGGAGGVGPGRGNGREENEEAVAVPGFQFRNLSTGDVDVFDPAGGVGGVKERAATDDSGGQTADSRAPPSLSTWQPHPSNIGLKITQSFANASWPWASSKSAGSGVASGGSASSNHGSSDEPKQSLTPSLSPPAAAPPAAPSLAGGSETSGEIGDGSRGTEGMSVSVDDSDGTFSMSAIVGVSAGGRVRARSGMKDVVPSLRLDDDDDDDVGVVVERGTVNEGVADNVYDSSAADDMYGAGAGAGVHFKGGVNGSAVVGDEKRKEEDGAEEMGKTNEKDESGNVREGTGAGGVLDVSGALRCHACGGTVEGPRHSTCTCEVPDLSSTPEAGSRGPEAIPAVMTAPAAAIPVAAAAVGFSKLKGVFKSFNGKVEVARQMLDSAVRQNIADNIPRPHPHTSTPASTVSKKDKAPILPGAIIAGSVQGSTSSRRVAESSGERRKSSDEVAGSSGGITDGSSGMTKWYSGMVEGTDGTRDARDGMTRDEDGIVQGSGEITDSNDGMREGSIGMGEEGNGTEDTSCGITNDSSGMEDTGGRMARGSSEVTEDNVKTVEGSSSELEACSTKDAGVHDGYKERETGGVSNEVIESNKGSLDSVDERDVSLSHAGLEAELEESLSADSEMVSVNFAAETAMQQKADIDESSGKVPQVVSLAGDEPSLPPSSAFDHGNGNDQSAEARDGLEPMTATSA